MIRYDDWFIPLQQYLSRYTGAMTIQAETTGKQPPYPFIAVKQTTPAAAIGQPNVSVQLGSQTIEQHYEMVLSLTVHGSSIESATDIAQRAHLYFLGKGTIELSDHNIAIVEVLPSTNRDVFLNIEYERRVGFDVRLRMKATEAYLTDVIETVNYKMEVDS